MGQTHEYEGMWDVSKPNRIGPYFQDMDGDTGIIGPGVNADAPEGCQVVDQFYEAIARTIYDSSLDTAEEIRDHTIRLMNLAYAEGAKAR